MTENPTPGDRDWEIKIERERESKHTHTLGGEPGKYYFYLKKEKKTRTISPQQNQKHNFITIFDLPSKRTRHGKGRF